MVAVLRELYAKSAQPAHEDKESAAQMLTSILEQAQAIGHAHATDEVERAIAWGGRFTDALSSAWNIVTHFVQRIGEWFAKQESAGEEPTQADIQEKIDSLAEQVSGVEVHAAIEEQILRDLTFAGVKMVKSIAQPGACEPCLEKAAQGPVPIDDYEPPPYHGDCRCGTVVADEE